MSQPENAKDIRVRVSIERHDKEGTLEMVGGTEPISLDSLVLNMDIPMALKVATTILKQMSRLMEANTDVVFNMPEKWQE